MHIWQWWAFVISIKWFNCFQFSFSKVRSITFLTKNCFIFILWVEVVLSGQVEEHRSFVFCIVTSKIRYPLSTSESTNTLVIFLNLEETYSRSQFITHSVKVYSIPTISGAFIANLSPEFPVTHYLYKVCFFLRGNCALRFIKNRFFDIL